MWIIFRSSRNKLLEIQPGGLRNQKSFGFKNDYIRPRGHGLGFSVEVFETTPMSPMYARVSAHSFSHTSKNS